MSRWYDMLAGRSEARLVDLGLRKLAAAEGETILEIGCGTGNALVALARSVGETGMVCGVDISDGMLEIAAAKIQKAGHDRRVKLQRGDAVQLDFGRSQFDGIFMSFTLELFDTIEIPLVLQRCHRALREDGRLCVVAMSRREPPSLMTHLYEWAHRKFPDFVDCRPILVQRSLEEAGFQAIEVTDTSTWGLPVQIVLARSQNL